LTARAPKEVFTSKQKNYKEGYSKAFSFFQQEKKNSGKKIRTRSVERSRAALAWPTGARNESKFAFFTP
jgi:hypothetical protein